MKLFSSFPNRIILGLLGAAFIAGTVQTVPAAEKPTVPIIVKDTTSAFWQIVLAGARKAGQDLSVNVPELGAQSESDINGQISILENAVSGNPAAIVIAPTQFAALGKPIDEAAKKVKVIGIDSAADSKAFTSFLTTDNVQGGRVAADGLGEAIKAKYGKAEGDVALIKLPSGETRKVLQECMATIGQVGNTDHENITIGKAGRVRWAGRRPHNRGVSMNPVDHPHGGGEGKTSGGRHPVTPWGQPTRGFKTRNNKRTDAFIVGRRKKS